jgi:riboflavin kinase
MTKETDPNCCLDQDVNNNTNKQMMLPIRMISQVVRGFGRGSSDLGIPTANLDVSVLLMHRRNIDSDAATWVTASLQDVPCGIYWGYCRVGEWLPSSSTTSMESPDQQSESISPLGVVYKAAISIGFNPTYGNEEKTVEPHLIAPESDPRRHASSTGETVLQDFYDQPIRLSVIGYLRPELPFEGLDKLVVAIKQDIANAVELADSGDPSLLAEKNWVLSSS